jgi:hypothetical protein
MPCECLQLYPNVVLLRDFICPREENMHLSAPGAVEKDHRGRGSTDGADGSRGADGEGEVLSRCVS